MCPCFRTVRNWRMGSRRHGKGQTAAIIANVRFGLLRLSTSHSSRTIIGDHGSKDGPGPEVDASRSQRRTELDIVFLFVGLNLKKSPPGFCLCYLCCNSYDYCPKMHRACMVTQFLGRFR